MEKSVKISFLYQNKNKTKQNICSPKPVNLFKDRKQYTILEFGPMTAGNHQKLAAPLGFTLILFL